MNHWTDYARGVIVLFNLKQMAPGAVSSKWSSFTTITSIHVWLQYESINWAKKILGCTVFMFKILYFIHRRAILLGPAISSVRNSVYMARRSTAFWDIFSPQNLASNSKLLLEKCIFFYLYKPSNQIKEIFNFLVLPCQIWNGFP